MAMKYFWKLILIVYFIPQETHFFLQSLSLQHPITTYVRKVATETVVKVTLGLFKY